MLFGQDLTVFRLIFIIFEGLNTNTDENSFFFESWFWFSLYLERIFKNFPSFCGCFVVFFFYEMRRRTFRFLYSFLQGCASKLAAYRAIAFHALQALYPLKSWTVAADLCNISAVS